MEKHPHRVPLACLMMVVTTACVLFGFWVASPDRGDRNILFTATCIAFTAGLLTQYGLFVGMLAGAGFIVGYLLTMFQPDPSGLGPLELVMPIQLALAAIPMALAAWIGGRLRARFSGRQ